MGKDVLGKLESYADYRNPALLAGYSFLIVVSPDLVLRLGGVALWVLLFVKWLKGE